MKYFVLLLLTTATFVVAFSQNIGINQANPTNSLHVSPVNLGDNPLRIDGVQAYAVGDTSLLMINTTTGIVKYINPADFVSIISGGAGLGTDNQNIDSLTLNGLTLTTFIENGNPANVDLTPLTDSAVNNIINNADTLFSSSSFIDSVTTLLYNNADTLLSNTTFINNLRDSIDTDVDSVTLTGTTLTIYENGNGVFVDLSSLSDADADPQNEIQDLNLTGNNLTITNNSTPTAIDLSPYLDNTDAQTLSLSGNTLTISNGNNVTLTDNVNDADSDPTNEIQTISKSGSTVTLSNGGGSFTDDDTQLTEAQVDAYANNNGYLTSFTEVDGSVTNELQTISKSGSTVTLSNGGGSFTDDDTQLTEAQVDAYANNNGYLTSFTEVDGSVTNELQNLSLSGTTLSISSGNNVNLSAFNGDITGVTAGVGLTGGGTNGALTINAAANNGITVNAGADRIQLGGALVQNTTITNGNFGMTFNLNGTGDFTVQDAGVSHFQVADNGLTFFGDDAYWRDGTTGGTNLMSLIDDGDDGRLRIYENGVPSVDLDANSQFVFNEQGLDRNFRVESNNNSAMLFVDAGTNRVGLGITGPSSTLDVNGNARIRNIPTTSSSAAAPLYADASGNIYKKTSTFNSGVNGFSILPSGMIMQWGTITSVPLNQSFNTVTFPIAFPNACRNVQATIHRNAAISGTVATVVRNVSNTGCQIAGDHDTSVSTGNINWFAIGF